MGSRVSSLHCLDPENRSRDWSLRLENWLWVWRSVVPVQKSLSKWESDLYYSSSFVDGPQTMYPTIVPHPMGIDISGMGRSISSYGGLQKGLEWGVVGVVEGMTKGSKSSYEGWVPAITTRTTEFTKRWLFVLERGNEEIIHTRKNWLGRFDRGVIRDERRK